MNQGKVQVSSGLNASPPTTPSTKTLNNGHHFNHHKPDSGWEIASNSSISRQNSMECWDYTIELECLQGPQGCCFACFPLILTLSSSSVIWWPREQNNLCTLCQNYSTDKLKSSQFIVYLMTIFKRGVQKQILNCLVLTVVLTTGQRGVNSSKLPRNYTL